MSGTNFSDNRDTTASSEHGCVQDGKDLHCQVPGVISYLLYLRVIFGQVLFFAMIRRWPKNKNVKSLDNRAMTCIF